MAITVGQRGSTGRSPVLEDTLVELEHAVSQVNLIASIDVSGRGGNVFFHTIFDRHPQVACCPLLQYSYSYIDSKFGVKNTLDSAAAYSFLIQDSYFRLLCGEGIGAVDEMIIRMGGDPKARFDRARLRELLERYFSRRLSVTRRELVAAPLLAYAAASGKELKLIKYVMIGDAISLRSEHVTKGFSGRIVDAIVQDFPEVRLIFLTRDPRATFASPRHQFVNALGNMYAITMRTYLSRLNSLLTADLRADNGCVYLYWLLYLRQAAITAKNMEDRYTGLSRVVKNEDLNTSFPRAMQSIAAWLTIDCVEEWTASDFVPTIPGAPWKGIGAYNSRYQRAIHGPLTNDPAEIADHVTGPNVYVTRRWRQRLSRREIELIEHLFRADLERFGYEIIYDKKNRSDVVCLLRTSVLPFQGEMPTVSWLRKGYGLGLGEFLQRLFYAVSFPPFYVLSRILFAYFVLWRGLFRGEKTFLQSQKM